jgi:hypothetical protein
MSRRGQKQEKRTKTRVSIHSSASTPARNDKSTSGRKACVPFDCGEEKELYFLGAQTKRQRQNSKNKKKEGVEAKKGEGNILFPQQTPVSLHIVAYCCILLHIVVLNANLTRLLLSTNRFGSVQCYDRVWTPPDDYCRDQLVPLRPKVDATPFGIRCKGVHMKLSA